ncbi:MAG: Hsp70 family protein [Acetobacteraceae bacterium]|nr:Hsp70 family protein [Acetobacteraceae bacterium]
MPPVLGIDFGTTNTVLALLHPDGTTTTARFGTQEVFRSVLCFWAENYGSGTAQGSRLRQEAGPAAIEAYLDDPLDSRLIMSMKTYLAQRSFTDTRIFGRRFTLEALIATFLRSFLAAAQVDPAGLRIIAGRPVRFAGERTDDDFGETRLRAAFAEAGMVGIDVALEPEGAGYRFARTLTAPATVLIGDFGGGTSDFSLLRFVPGQGVEPLGHSGVGIAGDVFDYRIIDQVISPRLGKGMTYRVMGGAELPVPPDWYSSFARWHRLSLMRNPKTLREMREVMRGARDPHRLGNLVDLIEDEMGYRLYQTVSAAKAALSDSATTRLSFHHKELGLDIAITRADFEAWIAADLAQFAAAIDQVMRQSGVTAVDHVFLTGGTSFVPAVRRLFDDRFGAARVSTGGEFVSVAEGLALIGRDRAAGFASHG